MHQRRTHLSCLSPHRLICIKDVYIYLASRHIAHPPHHQPAHCFRNRSPTTTTSPTQHTPSQHIVFATAHQQPPPRPRTPSLRILRHDACFSRLFLGPFACIIGCLAAYTATSFPLAQLAPLVPRVDERAASNVRHRACRRHPASS